MPTAASTARGAKLFRSTDGGSTLVKVPQCSNIGLPGNQKEELDVTNLESTRREKIEGIGDTSTVTFTVFADLTDTIHQALLSDSESSAVQNWLIEVPEQGAATVSTYAFAGYVQNFRGDLQVNTPQAMAGEIVMTGSATIAHGATAQS